MSNTKFLYKYFQLLDDIIKNICLRHENDIITYDILDTEKTKRNKLISLKEKQRQMKIGEIWQEVLGNYNGCINLKTGHETGLDILSHSRKFIVELKNRTNTDNASSKKSNLDKLSNFKKNNPDYACIYANINADTEEKTLKGSIKKIIHDGVEIEHQIGYKFLEFILNDNTDLIIDFVKNTIDKYIQTYNGENFFELNNFINNNIVKPMDISKITKLELLEKCKELGITKCSSKNKSQLIDLINSKQINSGDFKKLEPDIYFEENSTEKKHTFIELCAGGGGLSSGLIKSGFTPILLNDNNIDCCKTLKHNHPEATVIHGSMDEIDYSQYINKVDLLTGGMPCQSFSQAGLRKGLNDPRGDLMMKFIEILNLIKPKIFMIENVKGLLNHDGGKTIEKIINSLNKNKIYNITYKCLDASKYDVPQKRERVFIVGVITNIKRSFDFPNESLSKKVLKDVLYDIPISNGAKYNEEKINLFKMIPQGGCWINLPENLQREYLGNSYNSGGGKRGILYRLSMEKPSLTLLCTPSQKQTERCHPLEERPLRIREYARIQTFDDNYEFIGSLTSQYKQIGNAVPVKLATHMGNSLLKLL